MTASATTTVSATTTGSAIPTASATTIANTATMTTVVTAVHEEIEEEISVSGRKKARIFKSGWTLLADDTWLAPDGKKFDTRRESAKYFNKRSARLEPERKDGWGVYVDRSNTHTDWVAPDGEIFHSYVQAKAYAVKSEQPIYGKDGLTVPLTSFFGKSVKAKERSGTRNNPIDFAQRETPTTSPPTRTPPPTTQTSTTCPQTRTPTRTTGKPTSTTQTLTASKNPRSPNNQFRIPQQKEQAVEFQKLCHRAGVHRARRENKKAQAIADAYQKSYTLPRLVSRDMHSKVGIVRVCMCEQVCGCVWMTTLSFRTDREAGDPIYIHLWQHLGHDCDFCKLPPGSRNPRTSTHWRAHPTQPKTLGHH